MCTRVKAIDYSVAEDLIISDKDLADIRANRAEQGMAEDVYQSTPPPTWNFIVTSTIVCW